MKSAAFSPVCRRLCIWRRSSRASRGRTRTLLYYSAERSQAFPIFTVLSHGQLRVSRERLRTPLDYSAERFPGLPLCTVLGHGQSRASRERLRAPLDYSAERFPSLPSSPSWVMVSRGRHASGSEHLWTTHPGGFCASPSSPSWVMVRRERHASGFEHLWTTRPSGFGAPQSWSLAGVTRAVSSTSGLLDRAAPPRVAGDARAAPANAVLRVRAVSPPRARRVSGSHFLERAC